PNPTQAEGRGAGRLPAFFPSLALGEETERSSEGWGNNQPHSLHRPSASSACHLSRITSSGAGTSGARTVPTGIPREASIPLNSDRSRPSSSRRRTRSEEHTSELQSREN